GTVVCATVNIRDKATGYHTQHRFRRQEVIGPYPAAVVIYRKIEPVLLVVSTNKSPVFVQEAAVDVQVVEVFAQHIVVAAEEVEFFGAVVQLHPLVRFGEAT